MVASSGTMEGLCQLAVAILEEHLWLTATVVLKVKSFVGPVISANVGVIEDKFGTTNIESCIGSF